MDNLKKFVDENHEVFNDIKLPEGHLDRFEKKLQGKRPNRLLQITLYSLIAAASVALFILFGLQTDIINDDLFDARMDMCENREEFEQLQLFYHMQMNDILAEIELITEHNSIPGSEGLIEASKQVLLASKRFENIILPELPCSEDGLFAINQHYQNSVESLNGMLIFMRNSTIEQK